MGLLYKYQDTLFSLFQMHATQDMQFRGGATSMTVVESAAEVV